MRKTDTKIGLLERVAEQVTDYRDPELVEHSVDALAAQKVAGLALGYEDPLPRP